MREDQLFRHKKVLPEVWQALSTGKGERVTVIVRPAEQATAEQLRSEIERKVKGATGLATTEHFVRVTLDRAGLEQLEKNAKVDRVWYDKPMRGQWREAA